VEISPEAVDAKLIGKRRGGLCFEHGSLFRRVLLTLGYDVTSLTARGFAGELRPRAHHALKVRAENQDWLVEVANGAATPTAPLLWCYDIAQQTPHGAFRLSWRNGETVLEEEKRDGWVSSYSLSHDPQEPADFEPGNWWTTAHPKSFYRAYLICTLAPENVRILLFNNRLTVRRPGFEDDEQILDADSLERCLDTVFGIEVEPIWRPHLRRAVQLGDELAA